MTMVVGRVLVVSSYDADFWALISGFCAVGATMVELEEGEVFTAVVAVVVVVVVVVEAVVGVAFFLPQNSRFLPHPLEVLFSG